MKLSLTYYAAIKTVKQNIYVVVRLKKHDTEREKINATFPRLPRKIKAILL